jgi:hypothetical protein
VTDRGDKPRPASEADLPALRRIVRAAYRKYLTRMDRPPAPMVRDLRPEIEAGHVWITGWPIRGLVCLLPIEEGLLIENVAGIPKRRGPDWGDN